MSLPAETETKSRPGAWFWVPSLYFAEGVPYVVVMTLSVIMYKRLGISNGEITFYTSLLSWPWVIKPLWSPLVDTKGTKRAWTVGMQGCIAIGLALAGLSLQTPAAFKLSLVVFALMAFASATHDIAADGFYMLSMSRHEQAWWVGLRSTFYRTAMIVGSGLLVVLAGVLESRNGLAPLSIPVHAAPGLTPWAAPGGPAGAPSTNAPGPLRLIAQPAALDMPLGNGGVGTVNLTLSGAPAEGQTVVVNVDQKKSGIQYLGLAKGDHGFKLKTGSRLEFNSTNWNRPAPVVIELDPKLHEAASVEFVAVAGNIPLAWTITLLTVGGLFLLFTVWHAFMLPHSANDGPVGDGGGMVREFGKTFAAFFQKPGVGLAMAFILFYRFDEAHLGKMISPFMLDDRAKGGLALTTSQVGLAYGTFGIAALTCGGLLGAFLAAKHGLKRMLPIMLCSMYLPKLLFVFLAYTQPDNFLAVCATVAAEQFGYGFGFTAFMLYMLYFADGPHKTAHYAICTGFMALGMMIPGLWSGWLQEHIGYRHFFLWVICSAIPGLIIALRLKIDPQFGKKQAEAK